MVGSDSGFYLKQGLQFFKPKQQKQVENKKIGKLRTKTKIIKLNKKKMKKIEEKVFKKLIENIYGGLKQEKIRPTNTSREF